MEWYIDASPCVNQTRTSWRPKLCTICPLHWRCRTAERKQKKTDKSQLLFRFYRFLFCLSILIVFYFFPGSNTLQIVWEDKKENINVEGKRRLNFLQTWVEMNNQRWRDILFHLNWEAHSFLLLFPSLHWQTIVLTKSWECIQLA